MASRGTEEETRSKGKALPGVVEECGAPAKSGAIVKKMLGTWTAKPGVVGADLNIPVATLREAQAVDRAGGSFKKERFQAV